ncbi:hypothetical protein ABLE68_11190 [Nocardioides sp. CN2-186]|uniref:hypothetical protein n=1 Tax=Nocardioides tweenelious TaxID=3156607 RepID=UPI0032B43F0F
MRTGAAAAGLLGGLAWLAAYVLDQTDRAGAADLVGWLGVVLLAVAVVGAGAALVSRSATWLRVVVALCFAALVWSLLALLGGGSGGTGVDALAGAVAAVVSVVVLARRRPSVGSHARE